MLRLKAIRPTNDKIVKIQLHPMHPWLVIADASDHVSVIYELKAGGVDKRRLVGAKLEKLAEGESGAKLEKVAASPTRHFVSRHVTNRQF
ncbi:hypothetical protein HanPI659440_Chr14g0560451 [Helianthus annuus]|nr:hypothetical protein HanPI659440_Chr14g0560451 [Helianthus annuus]